MKRSKEGKLEAQLIYPQDFFPVLGWLAYAKRSPHSNKFKEKVYSAAVNVTQLAWIAGLIKYSPDAYDFLTR